MLFLFKVEGFKAYVRPRVVLNVHNNDNFFKSIKFDWKPIVTTILCLSPLI